LKDGGAKAENASEDQKRRGSVHFKVLLKRV
jgi:hypothetical protein